MRVELYPYKIPHVLMVNSTEFSSRASVETFIKHLKAECDQLWPKQGAKKDVLKDRKAT